MVEARFVCTCKSDIIKNEETGVESRDIVLYADLEEPSPKILTPSGQIVARIVGAAADRFEVGKKYRVLFDEIAEAPAVDPATEGEEAKA